jgi:hypothetical protein
MSDSVRGHAITSPLPTGLAIRRGIFVRLVGLGAGLWGIGLVAIHLAAPFGVLTPSWSLPMLLATLPLAWLTLRLLGRIAGASGLSLVEMLCIAAMPALLLDGVVLSWAPWLYSAVVSEQRAAGGLLLWFNGVAIVLALLAPAGGARAVPD